MTKRERVIAAIEGKHVDAIHHLFPAFPKESGRVMRQ